MSRIPADKTLVSTTNHTTLLAFCKKKNVLKKDAKRLEEVTEYNYSKWLKQIILIFCGVINNSEYNYK